MPLPVTPSRLLTDILTPLIDTTSFYEDWDENGVIRGGTTKLENFYWFQEINWAENFGCQANALVMMNYFKHETDLQTNPKVPLDIRNRGFGGIVLWMTDEMYKCIKKKKGWEDFPSKAWGDRTNALMKADPRIGIHPEIYDCKCDLMKSLGYTDKYIIKYNRGKALQGACYEMLKPRIGDLEGGWPPGCGPCYVGMPVEISFNRHIVAGKVKKCPPDPGGDWVITVSDHPYQGNITPLDVTVGGYGLVTKIEIPPGGSIGGLTIIPSEFQQAAAAAGLTPQEMLNRYVRFINRNAMNGIESTVCDP